MTNEKYPDWKQWIPVYGLYQIAKDNDLGKPAINSGDDGIYFFGAIYHTITLFGTIGFLLKGLEKLAQ